MLHFIVFGKIHATVYQIFCHRFLFWLEHFEKEKCARRVPKKVYIHYFFVAVAFFDVLLVFFVCLKRL